MRWFLVALLCSPGFAAADPLSGRVVAVIDGDTLAIEDGGKRVHRVRLAEIDAPEKGQPFYVESARSLARVCHRKEATPDDGKEQCGGVDAGVEQVRRGMAWSRARQTSPGSLLYEAEAHARLRQLGLWAGEKPVPPWEWRKQQRGTRK
jgi:endonuclease YncB( thermonuclease family)